MQYLAMHFTNPKMKFGQIYNKKFTKYLLIVGYCYKYTHATHNWFCGPWSYIKKQDLFTF